MIDCADDTAPYYEVPSEFLIFYLDAKIRAQDIVVQACVLISEMMEQVEDPWFTADGSKASELTSYITDALTDFLFFQQFNQRYSENNVLGKLSAISKKSKQLIDAISLTEGADPGALMAETTINYSIWLKRRKYGQSISENYLLDLLGRLEDVYEACQHTQAAGIYKPDSVLIICSRLWKLREKIKGSDLSHSWGTRDLSNGTFIEALGLVQFAHPDPLFVQICLHIIDPNVPFSTIRTKLKAIANSRRKSEIGEKSENA